MIELIVGSRGSGKTKQMVDMINDSVKNTDGNIVCVEKSMNLTYDISHKCRLIHMDEYKIDGYEMLYGFMVGILAGDYDIKEMYVDGILKIGKKDLDGLGELLEKLQTIGGDDVKFVITVSADLETLPASVKKYLS